jgi:hypothetical protein
LLISPQAAADLKAVQPRQHNVQDKQLRISSAEYLLLTNIALVRLVVHVLIYEHIVVCYDKYVIFS